MPIGMRTLDIIGTKKISNDNFPLVISKANGIYRRLCNDTLLFKDDSLSTMCKIIESNQNKKPFLAWTSGRNCPEFHKTDFEGYLHTMSFWITSIVCFGIWGSDCDGIAEDTYGTDLLLWQVRNGLELASKTNKVLIVNKDLTGGQAVKKKNISYGLYKIFYQNYFCFYSHILTVERFQRRPENFWKMIFCLIFYELDYQMGIWSKESTVL